MYHESDFFTNIFKNNKICPFFHCMHNPFFEYFRLPTETATRTYNFYKRTVRNSWKSIPRNQIPRCIHERRRSSQNIFTWVKSTGKNSSEIIDTFPVNATFYSEAARCSIKIGVPKYFAKFTRKHLCQCLAHKCFSVNVFTKHLRTTVSVYYCNAF